MVKGQRAPKPPKQKTKSDAPGAGHNSGDDKPELTADEIQASFLQHRTSWNGVQAKIKAAKTMENEVKAALKSDGFTVKQMQIADQLATVEGEAKIKSEVGDRLKVARWLGHPLGAQMDLFEQPDRTPITDKSYDAGKRQSMENKPLKPPHAPDTEAYRAHTAGYHDHQRELAGGFKAPDTADQSTLAARQ